MPVIGKSEFYGQLLVIKIKSQLIFILFALKKYNDGTNEVSPSYKT